MKDVEISKSKVRYLRISPRKVRLVADLIRKKSVTEARVILSFTPKRAAKAVLKLLESAIKNAKEKEKNIDEKDLYISKITVDEGPRFKRYRPVSRGQANEIIKRTSHVTIILRKINHES